ncbi:MAG: caspase family protein, partial [Saprospiraceae bacterium]|nr:caspase family protein [Saprospiraceae bacterium]
MKTKRFISFFICLYALYLTGHTQDQGKYIDLSNGNRSKGTIKVQADGSVISTSKSKAKTIWLEKKKKEESFLIIKWLDPKELSISTNQQEIEIQLIIHSSDTITKDQIKLLINGQPSGSKFGEASLFGEEYEYFYKNRIKVSEQDQMVQLEVHNGAGTRTSKPLFIQGKTELVATAPQPNLHLLAIGPKLDLNYTEKDAQDFAKLFNSQSSQTKLGLYNKVETQLLTGTGAKTLDISKAINHLRVKMETGNITSKDLVILFISSHGLISGEERKFRIEGEDFDPDNPKFTSIVYEEDILPVLNDLPCKKLLFIDACHSGIGGAKSTQRTLSINRAISRLNKQHHGLAVISSSRENEASFEDQSWE